MAAEIKAIETRYKGYRFRSRLEARWAVFFDAMGIKWQYEPEGFVLPDGTHYLPDFFLPTMNLWVEVKAKVPEVYEYPQPRALALLDHLADEGYGAMLVGDDPATPAIWTGYDTCDSGAGRYGGWTHAEFCMENGPWEPNVFVCDGRSDRVFYNSVDFEYRCAENPIFPASAVHAFRSARFEHGQRGAA